MKPLAGSLLTLGLIGSHHVTAAEPGTVAGTAQRLELAPRAIPYNAQNDVMNAVNRMRRYYGIPNVYRSSALAHAAMKHARDMAARRLLTHRGSDGSTGGQRITREGFYWRVWGENIASGYPTAERVVSAWMASSAHRAIILDRRFQYIGVGVAQASNGVLYWCMLMVGR